jgi:hypothetical protein
VSGQPPPITEVHFRLLREFGRSKLREKIAENERREMWRLVCQGAGVPYVPHEKVVEEWKNFISGESEKSSLALNGDIDPNLTTVGFTYRGALVAAHTTRTKALLRRLMTILRKCFSSDDEYLESVRLLAVEAMEGPRRRTRTKR